MLPCKMCVFLLALLTVGLMNASNDVWSDENYYVAAVVEYVPINSTSIKDTILTNLHQYEKIIAESKKSSVDIIVFPECGLTGFYYSDRDYFIEEVAETIPSPDLEVIPCKMKNKYSEVLTTLSCAAQQNSMYIVVNLYEKFNAPSDKRSDVNLCNKPKDTLLYNTNVVFDRFGSIIARYRKFNLYCERTLLGVNSTTEPELSTFTTDFGVKFGVIICFDIIFKQPVYDLLYEKNVSAIIFSGAVFSELPFLVLPSLGAGWSYSMNTTLLFSDTPVRAGSFGGSGIFVGTEDPLSIIMEEHKDTKVLISKVPSKRQIRTPSMPALRFQEENPEISVKSNFNNSLFIADDRLNYYTNQSVTKNSIKISDDLIMNKFTFTNENFTYVVHVLWKINLKTSNRTEFKFLSFAGERNFSTASINNYVEACGITLCGNSGNGTCIEPPDFEEATNTTIVSIDIFSASAVINSIVIPSTLTKKLYPLSVNYFTFRKSKMKLNNRESLVIKMNLIKPLSNLITFGFYKLPEVSKPDPSVKYEKMHF